MRAIENKGLGQSVTVLVVDDHAQLRATAARLLQVLGHRTVQAETASEAVAALAQNESPIEVALLDLHLRDDSGPSLARRLEQARPGLRVLLMSGYDPEDLSGLDGWHFLHKPFSANMLEGALASVLGSPT